MVIYWLKSPKSLIMMKYPQPLLFQGWRSNGKFSGGRSLADFCAIE
ncbi:MAG: hypothetical protein KME28_22385 [Pelatocladus maniniholoensis HA4357-MV3]|uniref:Uncharacterized protein n=1 Tax=Pelatocladus maniniholoensis HA4357-MV3 TaxID=1117104 RepID=A0A9E3HBW2_9NOST|nr:hypothetical protein [Pelatocladus maniniholoensis HA4357-MV3]